MGRHTTAEKIAVFRRCFTGLLRVYGTYHPRSGRVRQVKAPVTNRVLHRHLKGRQPYGVYLLFGGRTRALVADFDQPDTGPPVAFLRQAEAWGLAAYLERSKGKGWHAWLFFDPAGVEARKARLVGRRILERIGWPRTELFPKRDRLEASAPHGSFINAPLFGRLVPEGRTVFVEPQTLTPYDDQWDLLANVEWATERELDRIIRAHRLHEEPKPTSTAPAGRTSPSRTSRTFGLPPCAQRMLAEGVTRMQRVSCFHLALQLRKAGLPRDLALPVLTRWASRNRPDGGKRILTAEEIADQTARAYAGNYTGCGCECEAVVPFCDPSCPLQQRVRHGDRTRQGKPHPPEPAGV